MQKMQEDEKQLRDPPSLLITGGTGSLGKQLIPHYLKKGFNVTVLSRDEDKQSQLMRKYPEVKFILGDVRDMETCKDLTIDKDIVIHAAALKRIEFGEENPWECIKTNLIGTRNMVYYSKHNNVKKFVYISTDKACKPINVYGMCKALGEKITTKAGYNCVRYGNVNNSRGSVLPLWKKQREENRPITLTNPNMTRFLIDFELGIKLIDRALSEMNGGIYVPKLEAANMETIARLFGNDLKIIGERAGEKLHEELIHRDEFRGRVEEWDWFYIIHPEAKFGGYDEEYTSENARRLEGDELRERLKEFL